MRRLFSAKFLGIISMVAFLMSGPQLYAQMDDFFGGDDGGAAELKAQMQKVLLRAKMKHMLH